LNSALDQRGVDHDVIIVDDGSADPGALKALIARRKDPRLSGVRLHRSRGAAAARNTGVARARGDWVAFLDDDDLWAPEKLRRQIAAAGHGVGFVYSGAVTVDDWDRVIRLLPAPDPATLAERLFRANIIPAGSSNVMVSRDAMLEIGGFDESLRFLPDWDLWIRLVGSTRPAADTAIAVAYVLHSANSAVAHVDGLRTEIAALAIKHRRHGRHAPDPVQVARWIAASQRQGREHGRAARLLLRTAVRHRDPGSMLRAVHAALRLADSRRAGDVPEARWIAQCGRSASQVTPSNG